MPPEHRSDDKHYIWNIKRGTTWGIDKWSQEKIWVIDRKITNAQIENHHLLVGKNVLRISKKKYLIPDEELLSLRIEVLPTTPRSKILYEMRNTDCRKLTRNKRGLWPEEPR